MPRATYTPAQRQEALDAYREHGPAEAERLTGVPKKTIASWARRHGVQTDAAGQRERTVKAVRAAEMAWAQRRAALADKAGQLAETLVDRAFEEREARDQKLLVEAAEKAGGMAQLLTGGATSRHEDVTDPQRRLALVRELKTRRDSGQATG